MALWGGLGVTSLAVLSSPSLDRSFAPGRREYIHLVISGHNGSRNEFGPKSADRSCGIRIFADGPGIS